jgi:amidohydrolase
MARLGTRTPGDGRELDIHQGTFDVDESCIGVGVRTMAATAFTALWEGRRPTAEETAAEAIVA